VLVPKLQLGNSVVEALGNRSCVALPPASMQSQLPVSRSWSFVLWVPKPELGNQRKKGHKIQTDSQGDE